MMYLYFGSRPRLEEYTQDLVTTDICLKRRFMLGMWQNMFLIYRFFFPSVSGYFVQFFFVQVKLTAFPDVNCFEKTTVDVKIQFWESGWKSVGRHSEQMIACFYVKVCSNIFQESIVQHLSGHSTTKMQIRAAKILLQLHICSYHRKTLQIF